MVGEPPAQRWANVFELSGKRRPLHLGQDLVPRLLELAAVPVPVGDLLAFVTPEDLAQAGFRYLSSACAVDALRGLEAGDSPVRENNDDPE